MQSADAKQIHESDKDLLLLQWAISDDVRELCTYLIQHPHEVRSTLQPQIVVGPGLRGPILAAPTIVEQSITGDSARFVFLESMRTQESGPNRVLRWTVTYALTLGRRFRSLLPAESTYRDRTQDALKVLESAGRMLPAYPLSSKPSAGDLRAARASRSILYRSAANAFDFLQRIETLDEGALRHLIDHTLVGPTEYWRQFELALALAMASEISRRTGAEMALKWIVPDALDSLIVVGDYILRWQRAAPSYQGPQLERWELHVDELIRSYGISPGYDRPDVVVYNRITDDVLAVGEAKYFESDSWKDRLRDAVGQVVMYARGYEHVQDAEGIIARSVIALWKTDTPVMGTASAPIVATFAMIEEAMAEWGSRCFGPVA